MPRTARYRYFPRIGLPASVRVRRCSACRMQGHMVSTCPLVQDPCYQCVTRCGQTTCAVCPVACMTCKIPGHTEDMQSCVIPKGREAKFVCEMHDIAAMHTRLQVIIDARELTPRQLKEKRSRAKQSLIATAGDSERESHVASHVARSTIVDDAELLGAAAQPRTCDADAAVAAALDTGATWGCPARRRPCSEPCAPRRSRCTGAPRYFCI